MVEKASGCVAYHDNLRNTMTFNVYIDGVRLKTCAEPASQGSKVTMRASAMRYPVRFRIHACISLRFNVYDQ